MPVRYLQMSQVDNMLPEQPNCTQVDANDSDSECNMDRIPFAKNTFRMDIKHFSNDKLPFKVANSQDKENMSSAGNICKDEETDPNDSVDDEIAESNNRPVTPANTEAGPGQPLTPTANLKVLFNAMSPELRNREEQKRDTSDEDSPESSQEERRRALDGHQHDHSDYQFETIIELTSEREEKDRAINDLLSSSQEGSSRKEKSLGLLCQKFLQKYPEYPKPYEAPHKICLDEVAKELKVERRRIYDIVNVLESVEIVSRIAKNMYAWHGKSNLRTTLAKLKVLGESEGFAEQIQRLKDFEFNRELEQQLGKYAPKTNSAVPDLKDSTLLNQAALRKDKSLGIMSQKFLMLFLVSKPKTVNLDLSAKLLIGDANIDKTENAKFKTKIRRLYDIANILTSLDLIRKVHVTEIRGRKPAFKYIGPDIEDNDELNNMLCCSDGVHRPCSRHSMLDCIQNQEVANILHSYKPKPTKTVSLLRAEAEDERLSNDVEGSPSKLKFGRHSSFDQICAVAEQERNKLYASASEPASPTEKVKEDSQKMSASQPVSKEGKPTVLLQSDDGNFQVLNADGFEDRTGENTHKLPTKGFVRKKSQQKIIISEPTPSGAATKGSKASSEAIIIKTSGSRAPAGVKQPTVIPLTKDQIDAVLRSLKVPVPLPKQPPSANPNAREYFEEVTMDGVTKIQVADMKEANERTPIVNSDSGGNAKCSDPDNKIPAEKRVRLDFPSPGSGDDESPSSSQEKVTVMRLKRTGDEVKPSPQRALHLTPGFNVGSPSKRIRIEVTPGGDAMDKIIINRSALNPAKPRTPMITRVIQSPGSKAVGVQLSNQPSTVFSAVSHQIMQSNGKSGPNIVVPAGTFSPPLTPNSNPASPRIFFPSTHQPNSSISLTNVHVVQATNVKVQSPGSLAQLIKPIATKPTLSPNPGSQIVPPQLVTSSSILSSQSQGGFVPITNSVGNVSKVIITQNSEPTARKIGFDDITAAV